MEVDIIARAETDINASKDKVWNALVDPALIKEYMFGTTVKTNWQPGSTITWSGEWEGKPYEDKGEILKVEEGKLLQYTHFSPLTGEDDKPENYHTVTVELFEEEKGTHVVLSQEGNKDLQAKEHSEKNWKMMLESMKKVLES
jgi:uncharacterized protein YndB with AHSA1/START domain